VKLEPAIRRSVCPEPPAGLLSPVEPSRWIFGTEHVTERPTGERLPISTGGAELADQGRSVDGVRGPATVGFLLVAAGLAVRHFVDCLAEAGCLAGGQGERDWMRPSVVRVSADSGNPADLGNDSLPDAVSNAYATTRSDLTSLAASTAVCYREGPPNMTTD
jgi:hypothetical protein